MFGTIERMKRASVSAQLRRHQQHCRLARQLLALRGFRAGDAAYVPPGPARAPASRRCYLDSEFVNSCSRSGSSVMTGSSVDMPAMSCTI